MLRRHANRVSFGSKKIWAQLTNSRDQLSLQIGFPFCQHLWDLTNRRDDLAVVGKVADMAADMEMDMVAGIMADMVANNKKRIDMS